jgi:hypothetical protein
MSCSTTAPARPGSRCSRLHFLHGGQGRQCPRPRSRSPSTLTASTTPSTCTPLRCLGVFRCVRGPGTAARRAPAARSVSSWCSNPSSKQCSPSSSIPARLQALNTPTYATASPSLTIASNTRSTPHLSPCLALSSQMPEEPEPRRVPCAQVGMGQVSPGRGCPCLGCCSLDAKGALSAAHYHCVETPLCQFISTNTPFVLSCFQL